VARIIAAKVSDNTGWNTGDRQQAGRGRRDRRSDRRQGTARRQYLDGDLSTATS
jgi:biotin-(acetyl-CoA carboxylase) ligase